LGFFGRLDTLAHRQPEVLATFCRELPVAAASARAPLHESTTNQALQLGRHNLVWESRRDHVCKTALIEGRAVRIAPRRAANAALHREKLENRALRDVLGLDLHDETSPLQFDL